MKNSNIYSDTQTTESDKDLSIDDLVNRVKIFITLLRKRLVSITVVSLLFGVVGFIYAKMKPELYLAELTFALEEEKQQNGGGLSGALGIASSLGIDIGSGSAGAFSGSNLLELMKSRYIVEKTLLTSFTLNNTSTTLADYYIEKNKLNKKWTSEQKRKFLFHSKSRDSFSKSQDSILGHLYKKITFNKDQFNVRQKDKKVSIIVVEFKSNDELFSKKFVENLVSQVSDFYIETKSKRSKINVDILQKQVDSVKQELNLALGGAASYSENIFNLNNALTKQRTPLVKKQIDVEANKAILTQIVTNLELAKVNLRKETPLIQIIDRPILPLEIIKESPVKFGITIFIAVIIVITMGLFFNDLIKRNPNSIRVIKQ